MTPSDIAVIYESLIDQARRVYLVTPPGLFPTPDLAVDPEAQTTERSFAFFQWPAKDSAGGGMVAISPVLNEDQTIALLAHEVGHWVHYCIGRDGIREVLEMLPRSDERLADAIGSSLLGCPIVYAKDNLVQTIDTSVPHYPYRPAALG